MFQLVLKYLYILLYTFDTHPERVERFLGGYKECMPVFAAEAYVSGPAFIDVNMFDLFAGRVEDRYPPAGKVNVALVVDCHAV